MGAGVFAGTTIDPSALVQRLDLDARSVASIRRGEGRRGGPRVGACGLVLSLLPRARGLGRAEVRARSAGCFCSELPASGLLRCVFLRVLGEKTHPRQKATVT